MAALDTAFDIARSTQPTASPFLKWAGGKARLLDQFAAHMPHDFERYHEPFVGGGAMFFALAPDDAVLSDVNPRLIETYRAVRDDVDGLIERLHDHARRHNKAHYYASRLRFNEPRTDGGTERAALFIYLNKTCFNGLYRENSRGGFNVPMGRYANPTICDESTLRSASRALQNVDLRVGGFVDVLERVDEGDFVYFDPPYVPLSTTSNFTTYSKDGFGMREQLQLARTFAKLARRGCRVMLSNHDCDAVRELYAGWRIETVSASRSISRNGKKRKPVGEVLVCSW